VTDGGSNCVAAFDSLEDLQLQEALDLLDAVIDQVIAYDPEEDDPEFQLVLEPDDDEVEESEQGPPERLRPLIEFENLTSSLSRSTRLPCAAHTLQLGIKDSLKLEEFAKLLKKLATFVSKAKHSTLCMDYLRSLRKALRTAVNNEME
jgi:hypothetical protein